jgi:KDO2-lipid IV(A) lauroyltransferase
MRANIEGAGFGQYLSAAIAESGKSIVELPFIWCAKPERVACHASEQNYELVQETLDSGRGIVFLTPHLGCFEITAQQVALRTALTVMYRPPRQAALKPLVEGARARKNLSLAPANLSGVRMLAKCLRKGEPVGVLPDQVPQEGEGVWAEFFGRPAYTMTLPAKLAQMGRARILITYAERLPRGKGYLIKFFPFDNPLDGTPEEQARAINEAMEQIIARCPAQYFWSYNRYKVPRGAPPPAVGLAPSSGEGV